MFSNRRSCLFAFCAFFALASFCQSQVSTGTAVVRGGAVGSGGGVGSVGGVVGFATGIGLGPGVVGKPFCADIETVRNQVLADGNRIQNTGHERICRDSQGRVRTEAKPMIINAPRADVPDRTMVSIIDPTDNTNYTLLADQHRAIKHQFRLPSFPASAVRFSKPVIKPIPSRSTDDVKDESLGAEVINGLMVKGSRITTVIPAGAVGNEQPLTITMETWMSEDLHQPILTKQFDPRSGEMIREMKNITREEPDPSLFQVPPDYTVEEVPPPQSH